MIKFLRKIKQLEDTITSLQQRVDTIEKDKKTQTQIGFDQDGGNWPTGHRHSSDHVSDKERDQWSWIGDENKPKEMEGDE